MMRVAKILKSNGTDGGLLISSEVDFASLDFSEPVYIPFEGLDVPYFVQSCRERGSRYIIHLNDVTSLEDAEEMVGREMFADVSAEDDDEQDFTGWSIYDGGDAATFGHSAAPVLVGRVTGDEPIPGNSCFCLFICEGRAVIPTSQSTRASPGPLQAPPTLPCHKSSPSGGRP